MNFQVKEPILVIGIGGAGSKLAIQAKDVLNSDCLIISNDKKDTTTISGYYNSIKISTDPVINPSIQLIRGSAYRVADKIRTEISNYSTVVLMANLAGKTGSAISPLVSEICRESDKGLVSFAIMPFKFEKDRIFNSGVSLKRVNTNSHCTVILDNDSLLESNPDLSPNQCYIIANNAIMHIVDSLVCSEIPDQTNILTTSKDRQNLEESLRDSLKMLYDNALPDTVKRSMLYVVGGNDIPAGILNSITNLTRGILDETSSQMDLTTSSKESKIVMLSSIQGMTKFEKYDPLGMIPKENMLDWSQPDCSIDCKIDLYQLE
jgi:cell division protein FtsZ